MDIEDHQEEGEAESRYDCGTMQILKHQVGGFVVKAKEALQIKAKTKNNGWPTEYCGQDNPTPASPSSVPVSY